MTTVYNAYTVVIITTSRNEINMKPAQEIVQEHVKTIREAGLASIVAIFFGLAVFAALAAWDRSAHRAAVECQEACVKW